MRSGLFQIVLVASVVFVCAKDAIAQSPAPPIRPRPGTTIVAPVDSQAALIRAQADRLVGIQEANRLYGLALQEIVQAASTGVDLDLKKFDAYWNKKQERNRINWNRLEERIENAKKPMMLDAARKVAVWERTVSGDINKIRTSIRSGALLNRMAQQIDASSGLSSSDSVSTRVSGRLPTLDTKTLQALNLSAASMNGPVAVSVTSRMPPILSRWPYLFRDPDLSHHAYQVNAAVEKLFAPNTTNLQKFTLEKEALKALSDATNAFYRKHRVEKKRSSTTTDSRRFAATERFLSELRRTIYDRAERDNSVSIERPSYFDAYGAEERNAATLIQYMMRYGLEFQRASPGTEVVYDRLFIDFRNLANELKSAPLVDDITEPMIDLDLDELIAEPADREK